LNNAASFWGIHLKTQSLLVGLIVTSIFSLALNTIAQVNSWTNPVSGNWHDASWSLGELPNSSHQFIVLNWPAGYTLQTATNISGPFTDINTASPYTIQPGSERQRYFRLGIP
jgi:hypothetical protein